MDGLNHYLMMWRVRLDMSPRIKYCAVLVLTVLVILFFLPSELLIVAITGALAGGIVEGARQLRNRFRG